MIINFINKMKPHSRNAIRVILNITIIISVLSLVLSLLFVFLGYFTSNEFLFSIAGVGLIISVITVLICLCFTIVLFVFLFIDAIKRVGAIKLIGIQVLIFVSIYVVITFIRWLIDKNVQILDLIPNAIILTLLIFMYREIYKLVKRAELESITEINSAEKYDYATLGNIGEEDHTEIPFDNIEIIYGTIKVVAYDNDPYRDPNTGKVAILTISILDRKPTKGTEPELKMKIKDNNYTVGNECFSFMYNGVPYFVTSSNTKQFDYVSSEFEKKLRN